MVEHRRGTYSPRPVAAQWLAQVDAELRPWARRTARVLRARGGAARETRFPAGAVECEVERAHVEPRYVYQRTLWGGERKLCVGDAVRVVRSLEVRSLVVRQVWAGAVDAWYEGRARALERGVEHAVGQCRQRRVLLACSACRGECAHETRKEVDVFCGHRLCGECSRRFYGQTRKRMVRAAMARMRDAAREPFRKPRVEPCDACGKVHPRHPRVERHGRRKVYVHGNSRCQLWTLSVSHRATASETRGLIVQGWVRLRSWLQKLLGRSLPFALAWEHTDGDDGRPHVHAHVLIVAPPLCWRVLSEEWQRATDGYGGGIGHARKGTDPRRGIVSAQAAARYMAKYASKGSADDAGSPVLAAEVFAASYMQRRVSTSRAWWVREPWRHTPCCGSTWALVAIAPGPCGGYGAVDGQVAPPRTPPRAEPPS